MIKKTQINSILIRNENSFIPHSESEEFKSSENIFKSFKTINFFIGQNNSGKSRFLRILLDENKFYGYSLKDLNEEILNAHFKEWDQTGIGRELFQNGNLNARRIKFFKIFSTDQSGHFQKAISSDRPCPSISDLREIHRIIEEQLRNGSIRRYNNPQAQTVIEETKLIDKLKSELSELIKSGEDFNNLGKKKYYIPILRGMRRLTSDTLRVSFGNEEEKVNDIYEWLTKKEYFEKPNIGLNKNTEIFTGYSFYHQIRLHLLGDHEKRVLVKNFESFLSQNFFNGDDVALIPREDETDKINNKKVFIKIGNTDERPIHDVGDGLQQLIIILFPVFTNKERCLFFIEEPDLFMHPGMQKALVKAMLEHDQHQYFITTHSNHIIDHDPNLYDVATFHFSKKIIQNTENQKPEEKFIVKYCSGDNYSLMQDIGVKPSSVLLSNCTIWVEGITDRLYIKAYLEKFISDLDREKNKCGFNEEQINQIKTFKEDYHYSFIEYQGDGITHWDFNVSVEEENDKIKAIKACAHPFLIADGDAKEKTEKMREDLGSEAWYLTKGKEIENIVSSTVLKEWLPTLKSYNEDDIAKLNTLDENAYSISGIGIGQYLDNLIGKAILSEGKSGTLKNYYKKKLSEFTFKFINKEMKNPNSTFKLNNEQNSLCEKIIRHVLDNNK